MAIYLGGREQRVIMQNAESTWRPITAGVPQGSVLGPLLFLLYINDLCDDIESVIYLFADDCSLFQKIDKNYHKYVNTLNRDLKKKSKWCKDWLFILNPQKCVSMLFSRKQIPTLLPPITLNGTNLKSVYSHKHLGLILTKKMTWSEHILSFTNKAKKRIHLLSAFKYSMSRYALFRCYLSFVRPLLEYADIIFDNCFKQEKLIIENLQYAALRLVTGAKKGTSRKLLLKDCGLCTMQNRRTFHKLLKFFSIINHQGPSYLENCLPNLSGGEHRVTISKTSKHFRLFYCTSEQFRLSFLPSSLSLWNKLPANIRSCTVLSS